MNTLARLMLTVSTFIWQQWVEPHYEDSSLPNWLFDTLYDLSGWLELQAAYIQQR